MNPFATYRPFGLFRLLLALLVVAQHVLANVAPEPLATATLPYEVGTIAVAVFFALSGFVICEGADVVYRDRPLAFMSNRLLRILPHFVLSVATAMVLYALFDRLGTLRLSRDEVWPGEAAFAAENIAANLFGFLPVVRRFMTFSFMTVAWAISLEMTFYIIVMVALGLSRAVSGRLSFAASLSLLGCAVVPLFGLALAGRAPSMFLYAPHFAFGCALYFVVSTGKRGSLWVCIASLAGMALSFAAQPPLHEGLGFARATGAQFVLLVALIGLMTLLASLTAGKAERFDRWAGDLTYPLYLWHLNVMLVALSVTTGYSLAGLAGTVIASLVVAWVLRCLVDPLVDRARNAVRGGTARRPPTRADRLTPGRAGP
jgi:peptidoglycan/LPS O-acetylase OafA/YrhL